MIKYKIITDSTLKLLNRIKNSYSNNDYISFVRAYQQILADYFHNHDEDEYYDDCFSEIELNEFIHSSALDAFKKTYNIFTQHQVKTPNTNRKK